jgi:hypothetical protein
LEFCWVRQYWIFEGLHHISRTEFLLHDRTFSKAVLSVGLDFYVGLPVFIEKLFCLKDFILCRVVVLLYKSVLSVALVSLCRTRAFA